MQYLIRSKGLRINALASRVGLSGQGLRDILSGKSKAPKADVVIALAHELNVTTDWLLLGTDNAGSFNGYEMQEPSSSYQSRRRSEPRSRSIPIIAVHQVQKLLSHYPQLTRLEPLPALQLPESWMHQADMIAFEVADDQLAPELRQGSLAICTAETGNLRYLHSGELYAISFGGHFAIRRINNLLDRDGILELIVAAGFAPTRVPAADVHHVWRVQYVIRRV